MALKTLKDIGDIKGKNVLVRVDFNVPMQDGKVVDSYRIEQSLPTIKQLREKGAKILLMGHLDAKSGSTLKPAAEYLNAYFPTRFSEDFFSQTASSIAGNLQDGEVLLFENLRNNPGEEKNDQEFAKSLAALGDIYINEGFSVSHRSHASVVGIPQFLPSYAGLLMEAEIRNLSAVFHPPHPFLFILGGAKFDTKLPLIQKFLSLAEHVFVGGALANNIYKEEGLDVGTSLVSGGNFNIKDFMADGRLVIPVDVTVQAIGGEKIIKKPEAVLDTEAILDVGPETVAQIGTLINQSKCVLWNGPLGLYEKGFTGPTIEVARLLAESSAQSIVGGGDTLAAIAASGTEDKISFISTGGGAMLQFLLDETLPGIEALKNSPFN
jgi:phosphoglycerate kinase